MVTFDSPHVFKTVSKASVAAELTDVVSDIISVSGNGALTANLKHLNLANDRRTRYEDSENNVFQGSTVRLNPAKIDALVAAIEAVVVE